VETQEILPESFPSRFSPLNRVPSAGSLYPTHPSRESLASGDPLTAERRKSQSLFRHHSAWLPVSYVSATTTRPNHRGSPPSSSFVLLPPLPLDIPQLPRYTGGGPVFIPRAAFLTRQSVLTGNSDLD